jgi:uncharacterized protein YbjT (DUF2867 family)
MAAGHRSRRVCVLGGSGFVGSALIPRLLQHGYGVDVPTRNRARSRDLLVLPDVQIIEADVHDERTLELLLRGCDAVINLVGILNERGHDGSGFRHAHLDLAAKLVRACHKSGVRRLIQMSALKASAELGPSHYLRSKGEAENAIKAAAGDIDYTIFRPSTIFGARDSFTLRFARLVRLLPVLPLPCAESRFAPVFVEDVAAAFAHALEDTATHGRSYELCGPDIYSLREIVSLLAWTLGVRRWILPMPAPLARVQAAIGEYLPGKPFSLDNLRSLGVPAVCGENGLAALGVEPHSLRTMLPTYLGSAGREARLSRLRQGARR